MKQRRLSFAAILMILLFVGTSRGESISEPLLMNRATQYFKLVKNKDFHSASKLFHYPGNYSRQQLIEDMNAVRNLLIFLTNEFGDIMNQSISTTPSTFYHVLAGGGDLSYWQKHPYSVKLTYEVDFEKEGPGYVRIDFCNISDKWQVRQVQYGLPASRPGSRARIMTIMQKMMQLM